MTETATFDDFQLSEPMRRALVDVGYERPTPVQSATFAAIADGRDVLVQSRTGSGKTAAFGLPLLDRRVRDDKFVQALVLCPTRELANQVAGEFERLAKHRGLGIVAIYGGAGMAPQVQALVDGAQVVVGTPGRVLDHLRRGTLRLDGLRAIVLDEGDEMLSMGFAEELNAILEMCPRARQTLIFSATMPESIQRIASRHQKQPEFVALSSDNIAPSQITHQAYFSSEGSRATDLVKIFEIERPEGALIFCNTKAETDAVAKALQARGINAEALHGDMGQGDRERVLGALRSGAVTYLVATDVAARGIDIPHLTHVFNIGFPEQAESYVHRTGRTGRAGREGTAISLIGPRDIGNLYLLRLTYGIRPVERSLPSERDARTQREADRVEGLVQAFSEPASEEALSLAKRLLTHDDAERLVAGLVMSFFQMQAAAPAPTAQPPARPQRAPRSESRNESRSESRSEPRDEAPAVTAQPAAEGAATEARDATNDRPREPRRGRDRDRGPRREGGDERPRRVEVHHADRNDREEDATRDGEMDELRLAVGRRDGIRPGEVFNLVREKGQLQRRDVGRINLRDRFTLVAITASKLDALIEALRDTQWNDRPLSPERGRGPVTDADRAPSPEAPAAAPAAETPAAETGA